MTLETGNFTKILSQDQPKFGVTTEFTLQDDREGREKGFVKRLSKCSAGRWPVALAAQLLTKFIGGTFDLNLSTKDFPQPRSLHM